MPRTGSTKKPIQFKAKWEWQYAIRVVDRDPVTQEVTRVKCLMCEAFGRDENVGAKRKRTERVKTFTPPWRIDNMRRHFEDQHASKWKKYQHLRDDLKRTFFEQNELPPLRAHATATAVNSTTVGANTLALTTATTITNNTDAPPTTNHTSNSEGRAALAGQSAMFLVDKDIVEVLIADVLFEGNAEDHEDRRRILSTFRLQEGGDNNNEHQAQDEIEESSANDARYEVRIHSLLQFNLCIQYISAGISFLQAATLYKSTEEVTGLGLVLGHVGELEVADLCRFACAINLQTLKDVLHDVWAFSISLATCNSSGIPCLDVCVRFEHESSIHSLHLLAIPLRVTDDTQPSGSKCADVVIKCLDVVAPRWRDQLIGITTEVSANMMLDCARHIVFRLTHDAKGSLLRVWRGAHQLDRIMQKAFQKLDTDEFMTRLSGLIGHLRRQKHLLSSMKTSCPTFAENKWMSMGKALKWFAQKKIRVLEHLDHHKPACAPGLDWWIIVIVVERIVDVVQKAYVKLHGLSSMVAQQRQTFSKLSDDICTMSGVVGPLTDDQLTAAFYEDAFVNGRFKISEAIVAEFINEHGSFVIQSLQQLEQDNRTGYKHVIETVANFLLDVISGLFSIVFDTDDESSAATANTDIPPVLPQHLCQLRNQVFVSTLQQQRDRLTRHCSVEELEAIETQQRRLRDAYQEEHFREQLDSLPDTATFSDSWRAVGRNYTFLRKFCGGLASVIPDATSNGEEDFTLINWTKEPYNHSPIDFSLEAILHAKQFKSLLGFRCEYQGAPSSSFLSAAI